MICLVCEYNLFLWSVLQESLVLAPYGLSPLFWLDFQSGKAFPGPHGIEDYASCHSWQTWSDGC